MAKERLDILMVNRALADSREKARTLINNGSVTADGRVFTKAGTMVSLDAVIEITGEVPKYVSRGGYKLEKALETNSVRLDGCVCLDIGASTGGFTDCMLQNGAVKVYAVDVGTNQLCAKLRNDSRVISMEQTNIRYSKPSDFSEKADFASIDVSFISLTKILLPVSQLLKEDARVVCLIKPQFEAGRENIGKNGVVKDRNVHFTVISNVIDFATTIGFEITGLDYSPIRGPEGNIEYLLCMIKRSELPHKPDSFDDLIKRNVEQAHATL